MKTFASLRMFRCLLLVAAAMVSLAVFATDALAADGAVASTSFLQANTIFNLVADRARMLQVSIIFVALGIAMLWWRR